MNILHTLVYSSTFYTSVCVVYEYTFPMPAKNIDYTMMNYSVREKWCNHYHSFFRLIYDFHPIFARFIRTISQHPIQFIKLFCDVVIELRYFSSFTLALLRFILSQRKVLYVVNQWIYILNLLRLRYEYLSCIANIYTAIIKIFILIKACVCSITHTVFSSNSSHVPLIQRLSFQLLTCTPLNVLFYQLSAVPIAPVR